MKFRLYLIILILTSFSINQHSHEHGDGHHHHHHHGNHMEGTIAGFVIDVNNEDPRKYASISIVQFMNNEIVARGMSDDQGKFKIEHIPLGKYYLAIEYIGYEDYIVDNLILTPKNLFIDIGVASIKIKELTSDEVSVVASPIIEEVAKTTYPVAKTARAMGGSADEVLEQLPSISVNIDGNITLRGNSNVTILVDGRKSLIDINTLNANMIEKVEVMTTPSAKYDPDGIAGIINVVLVKNEYIGKTGSISTNLAERNSNNLSGTFNLFKSNWNVFTNYSLSSRYRPVRGNRHIIYSDNDIITSNNSLEERKSKYSDRQNIKLGVERYFQDRSLIAFDLTYVNHDNNDSSFVQTTNNLMNELINSFNIENGTGENLNYGIGYFIDNKEQNKTFSIQFDYDDHNEDEASYYYTENEAILTSLNDQGVNKVFSIDYSAPINNIYNEKSNYEIGMKLNTETNFHYADIVNSPFRWKANNNISSLYFNTAYYFTEYFGIQFGARYEVQDKESIVEYNEIECDNLEENSCLENNGFCSWDENIGCSDNVFSIALDELNQEGEGLDFNYNHNRIYPSLYFLYNLKDKGNVKFELGRRINRPSHRSTDPIPDISESESGFIRQGNPFLKPEDIYKAEISYSNRLSIGFIKTAIYYNQITNKLDRDKDTEIIDGEEYQILSWDNIGKSNETGFEFTFMTQPIPNWDLMLNGNYWHNEFVEGSELDQIGTEYGFWGMMTSKFKLENNQQISLYAHCSTPMIITTGEISSSKRLDISYMKKVNKKFNFTIKLKDVFDTSRWDITTNQILDTGINEYLLAEHRWSKRTLSINFEFKFGEFSNKKYRRQGGHGHSHAGDGMDGGY